jgi:hypothetical protein
VKDALAYYNAGFVTGHFRSRRIGSWGQRYDKGFPMAEKMAIFFKFISHFYDRFFFLSFNQYLISV